MCGLLMEASGNPDADVVFYGYDWQDIADGSQTPDTPFGTASGPAGGFPRAVGNPNVKPEKADTWTMGLVMDSPFDNRWISDTRVIIDYYSIEVTDAIGLQTGDVVMQQCADPRFNPTFDPDSPFCDGMVRNQTGGIGDLRQSFFNNGEFETSGIDISINWGMDVGPGRAGINLVYNYLIDKKSRELSINPLYDYKGTFGTNQNGLNGNSYDWQALAEFSYAIRDLRLALRWQFTPSIEQEAAATEAGSGVTGAPSYSLFDLLGSYSLTDRIWLRFGIENLFQKEPPVYGKNLAAPDGVYGGNLPFFQGQYYDTFGRRFFLGARYFFD
jgi:outer membrane receptor protein involved in Fe transport